MELIPFAVVVVAVLAWSIRWKIRYWRATPLQREILLHGKPESEMSEADWLADHADRCW